MRNKFIEIEQYLQFIEKLLKSNSTFYYAKNSRDCNKDNQSLYKQNNLFNAIEDARNFIALIIETIVVIQIIESSSNN